MAFVRRARAFPRTGDQPPNIGAGPRGNLRISQFDAIAFASRIRRRDGTRVWCGAGSGERQQRASSTSRCCYARRGLQPRGVETVLFPVNNGRKGEARGAGATFCAIGRWRRIFVAAAAHADAGAGMHETRAVVVVLLPVSARDIHFAVKAGGYIRA